MKNKDTILIVDDMEINRAILRGVFEKEYNLLEAENGEQAMLLLDEYHSNIAVLLLDLIMPVKGGHQVLEEMGQKGLLSSVPVVVITAEDSVENEVQVFDLGASDIVMKPFEPHVVRRRVQNIIELNLRKLHQQELIDAQAAKLRESNAVMIDALSSIIEYRSVETGQHIQRIRMFTKVLLEDVARCYGEFGLNERNIDMIVSASSMHDIGKIAIPDSILNKPGRLTAEEFEVMKTHAIKGCEMLEGLDRMSDREYLQYAYNICRYHHERWNGKGYPDGLKGDSIPVCAQVVGIADCYDALTTDRVYKKAIGGDQAFNMILNGECGVFSPKLLESFKNVRGAFAELARQYADGSEGKKGNMKPTTPVLFQTEDALDTLQMGQMKYFALLKYTDSTVMEVDLTNRLYHVVYMSGGDFELLKQGSSFADAVCGFANAAVHPDDRELVMSIPGQDTEEFFASGLTRETRRCRVYCKAVRDYRWYEITLLRVDMHTPSHRSMLVIWQRDRKVPLKPAASAVNEEFILNKLVGGVQQCLNDQWFTLVKINDGFIRLLGYSRQEIEEVFQNRYINLIYPVDRETLVRQSREQLQNGTVMELEYRVTAKDGRILWVLDKSQLIVGEDGREYLCCILVDITQTKRAQEELRLTLERHEIIMEQTNDIIFEWDIKKDEVAYSSNWEKKFGYAPIRLDASSRIAQVSHIHPEDMAEFHRLVKRIAGGEPYAEIEFRLANDKGRYLWCKIRAVTQFDGMGKPFKAVGVLTDIDDQKRASQVLIDKAERDELTRLYNKSTARAKIENYLSARSPEEKAAMFIVDVDDFKLINDSYGHMFGDVVLQEISASLNTLFRENDIVARIGGDEFLVFMKGISNINVLVGRVSNVIEAIHCLFKRKVVQCSLSCSVGVAVCPEDGESFELLFQRSDIALYHAKSKGKNRFALYDQAVMDRPFGREHDHMAATTRIETDRAPEPSHSSLLDQAFGWLYESGNVDQAVDSILEMIGQQMAVSRVYIFEDSEDGTYTTNTFEWCGDGVLPQIDQLFRISAPEYGETYKALFNENDVLYCYDISQMPEAARRLLNGQGIKSLLQCVIRVNGEFKGFIGVDDCSAQRIWTKDQIGLLGCMAKLIATFLFKTRVQKDRRILDE